MMIRYASLIAKRERGKNRWVAIPKRGLTDRGLIRLLRPVRHCQPSNNALSLRRESTKQQKASPDWGKLGKGESLGSRGGQSVNAEAGLHTRTGHLLPRTMKFPDARDTTEGGGGETGIRGICGGSGTTTTSLPTQFPHQPSGRKLE